MPNFCCVPFCNQPGGFKFPEDPKIYEKWRIAIKRVKWKPKYYSVVCPSHFRPEDFHGPQTVDGIKRTNRRLLKTAVPSIFPWVSTWKSPQLRRKIVHGVKYLHGCVSEETTKMFKRQTKESTGGSVQEKLKPEIISNEGVGQDFTWEVIWSQTKTIADDDDFWTKDLYGSVKKEATETSTRPGAESLGVSIHEKLKSEIISSDSLGQDLAWEVVWSQTKKITDDCEGPFSCLCCDHIPEIGDRENHIKLCHNEEYPETRKNKHNERMATDQSSERHFQCEICGRLFLRNSDLTKHKASHLTDGPYGTGHFTDLYYECELCSKEFKSKVNLERHRIVHSVDRPFVCEVCGKRYKCSKDLKDHARLHSPDHPFKCEICNKTFKLAFYLFRHRKVHLPKKPVSCEACGKSFTNRAGFYQHKKVHSLVRPHKCKVCDKSFTKRFNLIRHETIHSTDRPFQCDLCSKLFKRSETLRMHRKLHFLDRPYECEICKIIFKTNSALNQHKKLHVSHQLCR